MAPIDAREAGKGIAGALGIGGGADVAEGGGLDIAAQAAGSVLNGIFGGLPWELSASEIVDAVVPGGQGAEAAGSAIAHLPEVVGVVV